ncbi:MAG: hypothetical protein QNJ38_06420 [Prochloraceae cyanobacterium]|nr:hypothetical protein [Prochloraceae cyanobacterium]
MNKRVTAKNTKAEILDAFEELKKEKSNLEREIRQLKKTIPEEVATIVTSPTKTSNGDRTNLSANSSPNIVKVIENLKSLQVGFGSAVSNLSKQLITEASSLEEIQKLLTEENQQLQELHELESVEETTLEELFQSYIENSKTFKEEVSEQKETLENQIEDLKQAWRKEQIDRNRQVKERNENYQKNQQRDKEEYEYNLELERNLSEEEHEQHKKNLYDELKESLEAQEKQWQEREESITKKEKEYAEAKEKVEAFEGKLEQNIKNGKQQGQNIGNYQGRIKADLRTKEVEGQKQNYQLQIESLEQTIVNQQAKIANLSKQLDAALKQVQDLAVKAIEGNSNRNSFQAMKEIALEQAKNPQKSK